VVMLDEYELRCAVAPTDRITESLLQFLEDLDRRTTEFEQRRRFAHADRRSPALAKSHGCDKIDYFTCYHITVHWFIIAAQRG
jgi:hypothetical protein